MKYLILTLLLLSPTLTYADDPVYWDPCFGGGCVPEAKKISEEFMQAGGIYEASLPFVSSGSCYHRTSSLNPNIEHFGVVLIDSLDGINYTGGSYGFFFKENPYKDWTVQIAREKSVNLYTPDHHLKLHEQYAYADMNPGGAGPSIVKYWMRQKDDFLYVVGQWGTTHIAICRLQKNVNQ